MNTSHLEGSKTLTAVIFIYDSMNPGGTPYDVVYGGGLPPETGIFFRLQVYERVGISLVEVYKRVGKSVIWVCERAQKI